MKKIFILLLGLILILGMVGCKKNKDEMTLEDYKTLASTYETLYTSTESKLENIKKILYGIDPTLPEVSDIEAEIIPDGTEPIFSVNGKIVIKEPLTEEGYGRIPSQRKVYMNNAVGVTPTDNWVFKTKDDSLLMEHSSSIYGEIKSYNYVGEYNSIDCYNGIVVPYLESLGIKTHKAKTLFIGDIRAGYHTVSTLKVVDVDSTEDTDSTETKEDTSGKKKKAKTKRYTLNYGVLINNGTIVMYQFYYEKGTDNSALEEIVNNTISQISINGEYVKTE